MIKSISLFFALGLRATTVLGKFLLLFFLAKFLPVKDVGLYGIFITTIILTVQAVGLDFYAYNTRELLKVKPFKQVVYIRDQWLVYLSSYALFFPLLLLVFVFHILPWELVGWFYIILLFEHNAQEIDRLLVTLKKPVAANIVLFFRSGLWGLILCGLVFFMKLSLSSLTPIWISWIFGDIFALSLGVFFLRKMPWKNIWNQKIDMNWISIGLKIAIVFLCGTLSYQILLYLNRYILQFFLGLHAAGVFIFFASILGVIVTFAQAGVYNFIIPNVIIKFHKNPESLSAEILKMYRIIVCYLFVASTFAVVGIHIVLHIMGNPLYTNHIDLFYWLLLGINLSVLAQVPNYGLYISYHEKMILKISLVVLAFSIITNIILISYYGLRGAAFAGVVTMLFVWVLKHLVFLSKMKKVKK